MSVSLSPEQLAVLRQLQGYAYKSTELADQVFGEARDCSLVKLNDVKKLFKREAAANPDFHFDAAKSFIDIKGTVHLPSVVVPPVVEAKTTSVPRQKDAVPAGKHRLRNIIALLVKNRPAAVKAAQ